MKEKKDRVDDALSRYPRGNRRGYRSRWRRGIHPHPPRHSTSSKGDNDDENTGIQIIRRAIEEPFRQIVENAGVEGAVILQKVKDGSGDFGYNARTGEFENFLKSGVIDPAKVTRVALENAASIAGNVPHHRMCYRRQEGSRGSGGSHGSSRNGRRHGHDVNTRTIRNKHYNGITSIMK